ncbi:RICIN domain-containing protein [Streptomyces sp. NPDC056402]|uniref:RICIN domain-containing protein n=1 Tax=Streptomyces sp. NPDC056402 TaxID=3345810 RepID=UPI0035DF35BC
MPRCALGGTSHPSKHAAAVGLYSWHSGQSAFRSGLRHRYLFVIRSSKNPSLCLDLPGTEPVGNSAVGFYPCQYSTDDNQLWLWGQPPGGVTERTLVNRKSQDTGFPHCLDVGGYGNKTNGVPVGLYRCAMFDRNDDHLWYTKNG